MIFARYLTTSQRFIARQARRARACYCFVRRPANSERLRSLNKTGFREDVPRYGENWGRSILSEYMFRQVSQGMV